MKLKLIIFFLFTFTVLITKAQYASPDSVRIVYDSASNSNFMLQVPLEERVFIDSMFSDNERVFNDTIYPDVDINNIFEEMGADMEFREMNEMRDIEYVPKDINFIPAEVLYNHYWDNFNLRYKPGVFASKKENLKIIILDKKHPTYVHPFKGKVISPYGPRGRGFHPGTDVKLNLGDSVRCAFDGKVKLSKRFSGYGFMVMVRHDNGLETLYGHLSKLLVKENAPIKAGDVLGLGGRTGLATTEHLHFETRIFGDTFDSERYIDFKTGKLRCDSLVFKSHAVEEVPEQVVETGKKGKKSKSGKISKKDKGTKVIIVTRKNAPKKGAIKLDKKTSKKSNSKDAPKSTKKKSKKKK